MSRRILLAMLAIASLAAFAAPASADTVVAASGSWPVTVTETAGQPHEAPLITKHPNYGLVAGTQWIGINADGSGGNATYDTVISLPADAINGSVTIEWFNDDASTVSVNAGTATPGGSYNGTAATFTTALNAGLNTIQFKVVNGGVPGPANPTGLDFKATASYAMRDSDSDGLHDSIDNCPTVSNPIQDDADTDSIGDACDPDIDGDGVANGSDNCPTTANPDQRDIDADGTGDPCDSTFSPPASTCGEVEGEGSLSNDRRSSFTIDAESKHRRAGGKTTYSTTGVKFVSTRIHSVLIAGSEATIVGTGKLNGSPVNFRIDVVDGPGRSADSYRIQLSNGYTASGSAKPGAIEVEPCDDDDRHDDDHRDDDHRDDDHHDDDHRDGHHDKGSDD
jgi:hypothetical protein